jgi:hypothetical protein
MIRVRSCPSMATEMTLRIVETQPIQAPYRREPRIDAILGAKGSPLVAMTVRTTTHILRFKLKASAFSTRKCVRLIKAQAQRLAVARRARMRLRR